MLSFGVMAQYLALNPQTAASSGAASASGVASAGSREEWKAAKQDQSARRKREREIEKLEASIEEYEARIASIDEESADPEVCTNTSRLIELHNERTKLDDELAQMYEKWENLSSE